ncbi:glycosyltransferase family protein [Methylobrevis pamukkalensis]|uniref:Spore protein YkvP/CgeB glycosyl transferase-like domain-containing protein n=1 Tax=Methylobrevis pamukkalensis TaxID=1439726 RepID=A0A1E3GZ12_9HYPH|nr:glycosyltransferase [Methylobrevis pamukkalensis]ODN68561.1 hypothetical protein A6302_04137 [Methylobrevis pamukkalensis]
MSRSLPGSRLLSAVFRRPGPPRLLFVANGMVPTLQFSFVHPLAPLEQAGLVDLRFLFEPTIDERIAEGSLGPLMGEIAPDLVVFCRYSGAGTEEIMAAVRKRGGKVITHLDDDLLDVPKSIGAVKHAFHNDPARLATVRRLMADSDAVYFSNAVLAARMTAKQPVRRAVVSGIINALPCLRLPARGPTRRIGYMGFDHAADFALVAGALARLLDRRPEVGFDVFGPIPIPPSLARFADRIRVFGPVGGYDAFVRRLASLEWDVGICPLVRDDFNLVKSDIKWLEYTACGMATVASADTVYDTVCADGCGLLARTEAEWFDGLDGLVADPDARYRMALRAQRRLIDAYSPGHLRAQVLALLAGVDPRLAGLGENFVRRSATAPEAQRSGS